MNFQVPSNILTENATYLSLPNPHGLFSSVLHTSKQRVQDQHEIRGTGSQKHHIYLYCYSSWINRSSPPPSPWWQRQQEWLLAAGWLNWNPAYWELWEEWGYAAAPSGWVIRPKSSLTNYLPKILHPIMGNPRVPCLPLLFHVVQKKRPTQNKMSCKIWTSPSLH